MIALLLPLAHLVGSSAWFASAFGHAIIFTLVRAASVAIGLPLFFVLAGVFLLWLALGYRR